MSTLKEATEKFVDTMADTGIESMTVSSPGHEPVEVSIPAKPVGQLSFDVGGDAVGKNMIGTIRIAGSLSIEEDLNLGDEVSIRVVNAQGEVIASGGAVVGAPNFKTHRDKYDEIVAIERAHRARVF